jgi:hypothetical protein
MKQASAKLASPAAKWAEPRSKYTAGETEPAAAFFDIFPLRDFRPFRCMWERAIDDLRSISRIEHEKQQIRLDLPANI